MTLTETAAPRRRGPYRKRARLAVADTEWRVGDTLMVDRTRWIISSVGGTSKMPPAERVVVLHASNTVNYGVEWATTLAVLPVKPSKENR